MAIPEDQLVVWSHQGSVTQSSDTYATVKAAIAPENAPYASKAYTVFLQGSYGNDTNIYSESDVDVVIQLDSCFQHDLSGMPQEQQQAFKASHSDAAYTLGNFKTDVAAVLAGRFGSDVTVGDKAFLIGARGARRSADVVAVMQYRRYHKFLSLSDQSFDEGICFYTGASIKIVNYPKQHSANLSRKHQSTSTWLKPMIRIFKNMRTRAVEKGLLADGAAPSYYVEGLLYNVPDSVFGSSYAHSCFEAVKWLQATDRAKLLCANEQYYLLWEGSPVTWRSAKCDAYLAAVVRLWNEW